MPGLFPSVRIDVDAAGSEREELHVDGGVSAQVFLLPVHVSFRDLDRLQPSPARHRNFVIRNATLAPAYKAVQASALPISERSLSTLILNQSLADVQRIYLQALRDGAAYNLAAIPAAFSYPRQQPFRRAVYARAVPIWLCSVATRGCVDEDAAGPPVTSMSGTSANRTKPGQNIIHKADML